MFPRASWSKACATYIAVPYKYSKKNCCSHSWHWCSFAGNCIPLWRNFLLGCLRLIWDREEHLFLQYKQDLYELGSRYLQSPTLFNAFTGCDITSSFFNHGKCKFWDRWEEFDEKDELTFVFISLSTKSTAVTLSQISILERYILSVYYTNINGP